MQLLSIQSMCLWQICQFYILRPLLCTVNRHTYTHTHRLPLSYQQRYICYIFHFVYSFSSFYVKQFSFILSITLLFFILQFVFLLLAVLSLVYFQFSLFICDGFLPYSGKVVLRYRYRSCANYLISDTNNINLFSFYKLNLTFTHA